MDLETRARLFVTQHLLGALWEEWLFSKPDPAQAVEDFAAVHLAAMDAATDASRMPDEFKQHAIADMENFWEHMRLRIQRRALPSGLSPPVLNDGRFQPKQDAP